MRSGELPVGAISPRASNEVVYPAHRTRRTGSISSDRVAATVRRTDREGPADGSTVPSSPHNVFIGGIRGSH